MDICSNNMLNFNECVRAAGGLGTACLNNTYIYTCPTGVNSTTWNDAVDPSQQTGFKITATYAANSLVADCTPGQILQETITSNAAQAANPGVNVTSLTGNQTIGGLALRINNTAGQLVPHVGQVYGATGRQYYGGDNYVNGATNVISSQSSAGAQWWDNPDQTKDDQAENATWAFRFISFVRGSAARQSCSCAIDITVNWDSTRNPVTQIQRAAAGNENCP